MTANALTGMSDDERRAHNSPDFARRGERLEVASFLAIDALLQLSSLVVIYRARYLRLALRRQTVMSGRR